MPSAPSLSPWRGNLLTRRVASLSPDAPPDLGGAGGGTEVLGAPSADFLQLSVSWAQTGCSGVPKRSEVCFIWSFFSSSSFKEKLKAVESPGVGSLWM